MILPGHGNIIDEPGRVISERLRRYERKENEIYRVVDATPRTANELAELARGPFPGSSALFILCETLGYLDELLDAGAVAETEVNDVAYFTRI